MGYVIAAVILSLISLALGCTGSVPGRTSIFVRAPTGTLESAASQLRIQTTAPPPTAVLESPSSTAAPVPAVTPSHQPSPVATNEVHAPSPGPTSASGQPPEPTTNLIQSLPAQTAAPVPAAIPSPSPTLHPAPTLTPKPALTATATFPRPGAETRLIIECIFFDGLAVRSEADEYVQILNEGDTVVNLLGWQLRDVSDGSPELTFTSYDLHPQASVRVYTDEDHPESGGFSFRRKSPVWNNSSPDTAGLFNPDGVQVSTKSYPPGC